MKAVGFFCAVFLSMLAVFLVATGEFRRWLGPGEESGTRIVVRDPGTTDGSGDNTLHFDFWDVNQGRRNFTISAELPPGGLQDGSRIDQLQELRLEDGIIEIPLYDSKELAPGEAGGTELKELLLEFAQATYEKKGGLVKGSGDVEVVLERGRGTTNEGTEFHFEKLRFRNESDEDGRSEFLFTSDQPVSIVSPFLEVYGPNGLRGRIDQGGIDEVEFVPPVFTYLQPRSAPDLAGGGPLQEAGEAAGDGERVIVTCQGPLSLRFRRKAADSDGEAVAPWRREVTRITFSDDVVIYSAPLAGLEERRRAEYRPPAPTGNRFECDRFVLDIDDTGKRPFPKRAIATRENGRVVAHLVRDGQAYVLDGEQLEWSIDPTVAASEDREVGLRGQAVLTGRPILRGPDAEFHAERATFEPHDDRLVLTKVDGVFKTDGARRARAARGGARAEPSSDSTRATVPQRLVFEADEVEALFSQAAAEGGDKTLSRFVARSADPKGVRIRSAEVEGAGDPESKTLVATGSELDWVASERVAVLTGSEAVPPRLGQGSSWIESAAIRLALAEGPEEARFEGRVRATIDTADFARERERSSEDSAPSTQRPRRLKLDAEELTVRFAEGGRRLASADAKGRPTRPVRLTTLDGPKARFYAPEVRFREDEQVVELVGHGSGDGAELATLEREGGIVKARQVRFHQDRWLCRLEEDVEIRLYRGRDFSQRPDVQVLAHQADVEFFEGLEERASARSAGPLADLAVVRRLRATGTAESPLVVRGSGFQLRGEIATWESDTRELVFNGEGLQQIEVERDELRGPIVAREIVFDEARSRVVLQTSVRGELRQKSFSGPDQPAPGAGSRSLGWEFETHRLELQLDPETQELVSLQARDKVLLFNAEKAILLRGDDLEYEHARRRVRVFSRDGRRQTLQHFKDGFHADQESGADAARDENVDTIDSEEIVAYLYENPHDPSRVARSRQMLLVHFRGDVMAHFSVPDRGSRKTARRDGRWQVIAEELTVHVDPEGDARTPHVIPWAFASGGLREDRTRGTVTIHTGEFQARAETVEYRAAQRRLVLVGSPASIADQRPDRRVSVPDPRAPVIVISKPRDEIELLFQAKVPDEEPWPGVPQFVRD